MRGPIVWTALLVACSSPEPEVLGTLTGLSDGGAYEVTARMDPDPPLTGATAVTLSIEGADAIEVTPWMPSMGHGANGVDLSDGLEGWLAEWDYPMPGWWEVTVDIQGDHGDDTAAFEFDVR